ncbi:HlyD family efflux transporter periplasmic adaptor subunit [Leptolyngbya sp. FACHB-36]|uniref:HlyD family efflux transporter periplasmic adaptor subunit n=1 Tax=Leptolyngbya sp. FACHB-36 TaxID=2692808 RepID=UPI00167FF559|nr:HlyD family efflux transporter periplasmic adaptor subunit [Leptolyngbya sp. FACHB-36]MBD2022290.1 HlyD family efflux transporter periplasmic adaptor subunit [Leptolyngbya sp. FACHB-36]
MTTTYQFDQPVLLRRSPRVSHAVVLSVMGVTTFGIGWASVAKFEEAIPAAGKLEPQGQVRDIKLPLNGVVKTVHVQDGQRVKKGDLLLTLDPTAAQAQLTSLQKNRLSLMQETQFYRSQLLGGASSADMGQLAGLSLPLEVVSLTKSRSMLLSENQLYRAQLQGSAAGMALLPEQMVRLQSSQAELESRVSAAQLEVGQLQQQLNLNQVRIASARDVLSYAQRIYSDLEPVAQQGGVSRLQILQQQQTVRTRRAELDGLLQEQQRIRLQIAQAQQQLQNTVAQGKQELLTKIAENSKKVAEIDSQINKAIVDNERKIAEINSQISQANLTLKYQELRAPVDGTVFDLKAAAPGYVTNATETLVKIVPEDALVAKISITNKDIGFIKEGMPVDIRVDAFPANEFGDIQGELVSVGADALPPTQALPMYTFPAKVRLDKQGLSQNGRTLLLQSGMSVTTNIKVRQRTVMSIFLDGFTKQLESLKFVR